MYELIVDPTAQELSDLYGALAGQLQQIVRANVRAPDVVIDDACQAAWSRLVGHRGGVRHESALAWLTTTASREALRLMRRAQREAPLDALDACSPAVVLTAPPDQLAEFRARLDTIRALPRRQQRLMWLHGMGFTYSEIAEYTGDSERTVERQLLRAKRRLRAR